MTTPLLETDRLILRPICITDAPAIQKYFNDWDVIKHLSMDVPWPYPDDGAEKFIREHIIPLDKKGEAMIWGITLKENGDEIIGILDFRFKAKPTGDRGFWLARKFWGRGYMTETVTATQDYLFFDYGVEKFRIMNALTNPKSRRIKEKTGARYIGECDYPHHSGESRSELWEITKEDWKKFRKTILQKSE